MKSFILISLLATLSTSQSFAQADPVSATLLSDPLVKGVARYFVQHPEYGAQARQNLELIRFNLQLFSDSARDPRMKDGTMPSKAPRHILMGYVKTAYQTVQLLPQLLPALSLDRTGIVQAHLQNAFFDVIGGVIEKLSQKDLEGAATEADAIQAAVKEILGEK